MPIRSRPTSWPRCSPIRWLKALDIGEELLGGPVGRLAERRQPEAAAPALAEPAAELPLERRQMRD